MRTPLDDVEFLARSGRRVEVLDELSRGPHTRSELRDRIGASQATLGRILDDFCERGWARKEDRVYRVTPFGALLAEEFGDLLGTVETMQRLGAVSAWFPLDGMDLDLHEFRDATVTLPTRSDVLAHIRRAESLVQEAAHVQVLSGSVFRDTMRLQHRRVVGGEQTQEVILSAAAVGTALADPEMREWTRRMVASDGAAVYCYDGEVPVMLGVADGVAVIVPIDDQGVPRAVIESENPTVVAWVDRTIDDYRDHARRLTPELVVGG
ncbi:helix-turn-helix transcriptional regulator [Halobium salinum]|uniref:Helix-turn-helix transcriptional regulator n=1 Tax=Halobium salinum TaxID=1364940 RepID=A0ABD5PGK4_9EURY|nr:hypothetical protein [Halobium salinum]